MSESFAQQLKEKAEKARSEKKALHWDQAKQAASFVKCLLIRKAEAGLFSMILNKDTKFSYRHRGELKNVTILSGSTDDEILYPLAYIIEELQKDGFKVTRLGVTEILIEFAEEEPQFRIPK